ncbi:13116_t:CDS:10 [Entrophospora sp. SA101]|nr:13116_t:CDS:10 [Entrophospora sp. SA101]
MNLHRSNSSTGNLYKPLRSQHPTKLNTNEKNIAVTGTLNHFVQSKKLPVKNEELKNLLWLLQPGVPLPSADTIKNEIIKSFDKEHCWTSANTIPFLGITSHWINIDWQLQETLIDFLLAVTTDNAMNNNTFVSSLADICYNEGINFDIDNNHVRCLAHVMNIAVQHALKSLKATAANNEDEVLNIDDNDVNGSYTVSSRSNSSTGNLYKPLRSQHPTKLNTNEKNIAVTGTLNHFVQSKKLPVKNEELKNLLWLLQPGVPLPSADTIKNEIIKSFDKEHCWTSANTIPFLGITSHWINIDWQLQETLIDFLLAVTTDNAMNNNTFVSSLADICYNEGINFDIDNNHVHCLAHVMNIAVQHALKSLKATAANNEDEVLNIDDNDVNGFHTIMKLRKLIVKIKSSPQRQERFSKACELANLKYKELILDIVTRWNSTYEMIMCAIEYKEITVESVGRADRDMIKWVLNEEEWSKLVEISQLLHLFSRATKHISTNHYPTLTSTVLIFNWLIDNLEDYEHNLNGTSDIKGKVKEVIEKLKFYYIRTDASVYTIATILDPRLKLDYYRDNNWEANFINNAHQVIKDIYQSGYAPNLTVFSNPENNDIEEEEDLTAHIYKHQQIVRDDDELDAYLKSPNAPPKTDVLTWWKDFKR